MRKETFFSLLIVISLHSTLSSQVELYIHQPKCSEKTAIQIANAPQLEAKVIDEETILFEMAIPDEPKEVVFVIDTVGIILEKMWITPSTKKVDIYLFNCRQYRFYIKNPNSLTKEARANFYYTKYLFEKYDNDIEFREKSNEYNMEYIKNNPNSFLSLNMLSKININNEQKRELLNLIGDKNKKFPLYSKLKSKFNTEVNLDLLNINQSFKRIDGGSLSFTKLVGKSTVFIFWSSGCKWSINLLPKITALEKKYPNTNFVYYSLDEDIYQWGKSSSKYQIPNKYNISELNGFLGKLPTTFGVDRTPFFVSSNKKHEITLVTFGDELYLLEEDIKTNR